MFFGRKGQLRVAGGSEQMMTQLELGADAGFEPVGVPDTARANATLHFNPADAGQQQPKAVCREPDMAPVSTATVLRRMSTVMLSGEAPVEERQAVVLRRLSVVHDPNEVVLSGPDRAAHLVIANRRLLSARFNLPEAEEQIFDFRHDLAPVDSAIGCMRALSALCAAPVDLLIAERPFTGVFSGAGGFAIEDASFDEDICRAALEAAMQLPEEFDGASLLLDLPDIAVQEVAMLAAPSLARAKADPPLILLPQPLCEPAFAEAAAVFKVEQANSPAA